MAASLRRYAGVVAPVRFTGPVNGVVIDAPGPRSPFGILDCRLALGIDDLTEVLRRLGVTRLHVDNMYRGGARVSGKGSPSQHAVGLAVDILAVSADGRKILVESAWNGELGKPVCGPDAALHPVTEPSVLLRAAVCDVARRGIFHHMLTPNRNRAHADHLHFDMEVGEKSLLLE